jgi:hypothetical protein
MVTDKMIALANMTLQSNGAGFLSADLIRRLYEVMRQEEINAEKLAIEDKKFDYTRW